MYYLHIWWEDWTLIQTLFNMHEILNYTFFFLQGSLENDINQDFQDAIDVIQRHSQTRHYDTGIYIYNVIWSKIYN